MGWKALVLLLAACTSEEPQSFGTSCRGGTFKGNAVIVRALFRQQIPDYSNLLRGTMLN